MVGPKNLSLGQQRAFCTLKKTTKKKRQKNKTTKKRQEKKKRKEKRLESSFSGSLFYFPPCPACAWTLPLSVPPVSAPCSLPGSVPIAQSGVSPPCHHRSPAPQGSLGGSPHPPAASEAIKEERRPAGTVPARGHEGTIPQCLGQGAAWPKRSRRARSRKPPPGERRSLRPRPLSAVAPGKDVGRIKAFLFPLDSF